VRRFIEDAGNLTQSFGLGRAIGQIYAYLYFSPGPRTLADMQKALGISKGSASTLVRQLEQWGAARRVWVKGDRKDYYEANDWLGKILKNVLLDTIGKKMASSNELLRDIRAELNGNGSMDGQAEFLRDRIEHLHRFNARAQRMWNNPVVQRLLR
jgi:DNA-binding transcriptional regulator GbsR (MarR family)